jgi:hypothetical protein
VKVLGTVAVSLGAVWTLYQGVVEYGRAEEQRGKAPFLEAINALSDVASLEKRAAAIVTIADYMDRSKTKPNERSEGGLLFALRLSEEPSPALRVAIVLALNDHEDSSDTGLIILSVSNYGLTRDLETLSKSEDREKVHTQLARSAWAIGRLLQERRSRSNGKAESLDLSKWFGPVAVAITLENADLSDIKFVDTDFSGANFSNSNIARADFTEVRIDDHALESLCSATNRETAKFRAEDTKRLSVLCDPNTYTSLTTAELRRLTVSVDGRPSRDHSAFVVTLKNNSGRPLNSLTVSVSWVVSTSKGDVRTNKVITLQVANRSTGAPGEMLTFTGPGVVPIGIAYYNWEMVEASATGWGASTRR